MEKSLIVAVADNYAIGRKNALLWSLPGDMKYFREKFIRESASPVSRSTVRKVLSPHWPVDSYSESPWKNRPWV